MKKWFANHKKIAILGVVILIAISAVIGICIGLNKNNDNNHKSTNSDDVSYDFYQTNLTYLDNYSDVGQMILDCDDESYFGTLTNASVTHKTGKYVQGFGALEMGSFVSRSSSVSTGYFPSVDISAYKNGSIHISFYVSDPAYLGGEFHIEFTSSGNYDDDELCWIIPPSVLEAGWNELYLGIEDAKVTGEPDLTKINYYRMYSSGGKVGLDIIFDNVYATDTAGSSLEPRAGGQTASAKSGYLMDCDTLDGMNTTGTLMLSTAKGEYKEGTGAVIISNPTDVWLRASLKPADISSYKDGKLTFWLFINDASYVNNGKVTIELTSSGTYDKNEICWILQGSELQTGWNELVLGMGSALNSSKEKIDLTNVNYLRIFGLDCDKSLLAILDGLRVLPSEKLVPSDGMILNCDTKNLMIVTSSNTFSITSAKGEYKEGTGAFKSVGSKDVWWQVQMADRVDVSNYEGGGLHLWLYISDASKLKSKVNIEIGSGGKFDVNEYQWIVAGLKTGWNELNLKFENAIVTGGEPHLGSINFVRVFAQCSGEITTILDDVRAVKKIEIADTRTAGEIADCDSVPEYAQHKLSGNVAITDKEGEFKEGTGAFKYGNGTDTMRFQMIFDKGYEVDISEYEKIHLWFYVNDTDNFNSENVYLGIGSGGKADKNELVWKISVSKLNDGWNEIELYLNGYTAKYGEIDLTAINYVRIYTHQKGNENLVTIVDDVRAIKTETVDKTPIPGMIADCDNIPKYATISLGGDYSITETEGEYKEGTGAFKYESGTDTMRFRMIFNDENTVNISEYDKVQLWFYINDVDNINASKVWFGIGSDGKADSSEMLWGKSKTDLKDGWNQIELDLSAPDAHYETLDLSAVNYLRIFTNSAGNENLVTIVDDIRAVVVDDSDSDDEENTPIPGMILNCDSTENISLTSDNTFSINTQVFAEGVDAYKEGIAAFKSEGKKNVLWQAVLSEPVDISAYEEGGIHVWLYISDVSKLTQALSVEIGSAGKCDFNEYQWSITKDVLSSILKSGEWTELYLPFANASKTKDATTQEPNCDLSKINWFRVYTECSDDIVALIDDVRAVVAEDSSSDGDSNTQTPGVIADCDSIPDYVTLDISEYSITEEAGLFKEGTGAFKRESGTETLRFRMIFDDNHKVDISEYEKVQLWFYVNDVDNINASYVWFGIGSDGKDNSNEYLWKKAKTELDDGWNLIELDLSASDAQFGTLDLSAVNYVRIFTNSAGNENLVTIVDDVRAVTVKDSGSDEEDSTQVAGMIANCDTTNKVNLSRGEVTTTAGEYQEGTGAYINTAAGETRIQFTLNTPVDISDYTDGADGKLHLQFYIDNPDSLYKALLIEVGNDASNYYRWYLSPDELESGWNELNLTFVSAYGVYGNTNFEEIDYVRILQVAGGTYEEMTTIVDDIRVVEWECGDDVDYSSVTDVFEIPDFIVDVESGKEITVLQLSDTQMTNDGKEESRCYEYIRETVKATNPDFIIITGDIIYGKYNSEGENLLQLIDVMENLGIPWAPVFGNHDGECELGIDWMSEQLENAEHCLFKQRELTGSGNYTVGIRQNGELKRVFFMLDSNGCNGMSEATRLNGHTKVNQGFGQSQINWYTGVAQSITALSPDTKISFAFHIQIQAFEDAYAQYGFDSTDVVEGTDDLTTPINLDTLETAADSDFGYLGRKLKSAWDTNYKVWNGFKALGVDSIFVGHEHSNSASVVYDGIRYQYGQKTGTFDRSNYMLADGSIATSFNTSTGIPIVGGTVMNLADDGAIKEAYIYYAGDIKYDETSTVDGMILSGNTRKGMTLKSGNYIKIVTAEDDVEIKEGTGAFYSEGSGNVLWETVLSKPVDISAYEEGGIHVWVYISDTSKLTKKLSIEIGSAGTSDLCEYQWSIETDAQSSILKSGEWTELYLPFANASKTKDATTQEPNCDLSKINWFRVYTECSDDIVAMIDDVRAVVADDSSSDDDSNTQTPGLIADCDSIPEYVTLNMSEGYSVTTTEGEYKEGTGAFKYENGTKTLRFRMIFDDAHKIDISEYDKLHLWFYVNDVDNLGSNVWIGIGSDGKDDSSEYKWMKAKTDLQDGWNEIVLDLSAKNANSGELNFSAVNYFRIWTNTAGNENLVTIVDDIRAFSSAKMIADCDSIPEYVTLNMSEGYSVTTTEGEYKEGTGAFKYENGTKTLRFRMIFDDAHKIDISEYDKLHLWFYVNDVDNLGSALWIGVGSDGRDDSSEYKWMKAKTDLQDGWNEIVLDLSAKNANSGELNFSAVNYLRIWTNTPGNENLVTIVDDIYAVIE